MFFAKLQVKIERNFYQRFFFFNYQKRISSMDVFINLQLSANDFRVRAKGGKQQLYKKLKQIRYFNFINIAECWWKIDCTSEGSVINQSWSTQFPVATFCQMALLGSWTTCYVSATCKWVGHMSMPMLLSFQNSAMASFILSTTLSVTAISPRWDSAKCQLLRLYFQFSFSKILKALHTGLNIYSILEERTKVFLKMLIIDVDRLTLPRRPQDVIFKMHFYIAVFSIFTIDKHIDMQVNI